ncbi:Panacea domain-containing protein [Comamonas kerstersii]|uniref:Panacea domain-containing protein n=1 Tax=Comamonas kerstersii TaxID=225992 RepID=UPI0026DB93D5|nr:type II toxin-antitoxin system antitoxin SocA domain-containing protein [Comamonas kerstersii]
MYDVLSVADAILRIAKAKGQQLTPMQLVKLTYIAHGWSLAIRGVDLFRNRIEAWKYGPVIPDLYQATKQFGRNPIPLELIGGENDFPVTPEDKKFLEEIFGAYGDLDGIKLSYLTHQAGTPWTEAYVPGLNAEITDESITEHYRGLLSERSRVRAS